MKLKLEIKNNETDKVLFTHIMNYENGKIKFMPSGKTIKQALKYIEIPEGIITC